MNNINSEELKLMYLHLRQKLNQTLHISLPGSIMNTQSTRVHLKNVYSSLAVCMFVAAAGSYVHVGGVLSVLGSLGMMFWLAMTPHNSEQREEIGYSGRFAFLT
ncbi:hypothetical protein INR49_031730, partial [Caranx melampygus]